MPNNIDRWRDNFWIARFNSALGYTGPYSIWQPTYTEPGEKYGVQSDTEDVDFVLEELTFTCIKATSKDILPSLTNDTYKNELWLPKAKATATPVSYTHLGAWKTASINMSTRTVPSVALWLTALFRVASATRKKLPSLKRSTVTLLSLIHI